MKKIRRALLSRIIGCGLVSMAGVMVLPSTRLSAQILTGPYLPAGLVAAETGKQTLYVAANETPSLKSHLLVINTQFNSITADIPLVNLNTSAPETAAAQVALNPAGTLAFVVNTGSSTVDVINLATNAEVFTFQAPQIGPFPIGVRVTPNGQELWVACAETPPAFNNGTVSVIDLSNFASIAQINTGGSPNTVVFNSKGSAAYVLNSVVPGFVDEVNVKQFTIIKNSIGKPNLNSPNPLAMDITKDNSTLYIGNFQSYVNNVDIPTGTVDNHIFMFPGIGPAFQTIGQVLVSPDQKWVVAAAPNLSAVSIASTSTQAWSRFEFTTGSAPYFVTFSKDSKTLYVSNAFTLSGLKSISVFTGF